MAKKKVGKSVVATAITLSLVCSTGVTALATESSQAQEVSEVSITGVQQENTTSKSEGSNGIKEVSELSNTSSGGTSSSGEKKEEGSKYPTENVSVNFSIYLSAGVIACANNYPVDNFSISESNISFKVMDESCKKSYGSFVVSDKNLDQIKNNYLLTGFTVKLPKWADGAVYKIVFDNLPDFFESKTCDLKYSEYTPEASGSTKKVSGIDAPALGELKSKSNTIVVKARTMSGDVIPNALINLTLTGAEESTKDAKFEKTLTTDKLGYAYCRLPSDDKSLQGLLNLEAVLVSASDKEIGSNSWVTQYDYPAESSIVIGTVSTEMTIDDYNKSVEETKQTAKLSVGVKFKREEIMDLFKSEPVSISVYDSEGKTVIGSIDFDEQHTNGSLLLIKGNKYQVKVNSTGTYACNIGNTSLSMSDDKELNLEFTPQIFLKVYNEKSGVQNNANFSISVGDSEKNYSGQPVRVFALNADSSVSVINKENDELYSVLIPQNASTTKLNLATGSLGVNFIDSTNDSANGDGSDTVPKTGDTMPYVIGGMILVTVGCFSGWVYYKKKGDKFNEKRKKDEQK